MCLEVRVIKLIVSWQFPCLIETRATSCWRPALGCDMVGASRSCMRADDLGRLLPLVSSLPYDSSFKSDDGSFVVDKRILLSEVGLSNAWRASLAACKAKFGSMLPRLPPCIAKLSPWLLPSRSDMPNPPIRSSFDDLFLFFLGPRSMSISARSSASARAFKA